MDLNVKQKVKKTKKPSKNKAANYRANLNNLSN